MNPKERRFGPSADKVIPEEADEVLARANADQFIEQLLVEMDPSEYGPNALVPTPEIIRERYQEVIVDPSVPKDGLFSLLNVYGALKRRLLYEKELLMEYDAPNPQMLENIADMYKLLVVIEMVLPEDERPTYGLL